jgi:hypothetical protein
MFQFDKADLLMNLYFCFLTSVKKREKRYYTVIIPLLFVTVVMIGQKQNLKRVYTSINPEYSYAPKIRYLLSLNYYSLNTSILLQ